MGNGTERPAWMDDSLDLYYVEFSIPHEEDVDTNPHETYWREFWAESEDHAREQAREAIPDERVTNVERAENE